MLQYSHDQVQSLPSLLAVRARDRFSHRNLRRGKILRRALGKNKNQRYYLYLPSSGYRTDTVFVSVHGISRMAREHVREFAIFAEQYGLAVVAPLYPKNRFPDYQQLGTGGTGLRSDLILQDILEEVSMLTGIETSQPLMFGYSGGAQFVHRYTMAYPDQVRRAVVAASGWYTFPDLGSRFPYGIGKTGGISGMGFDPARFLRVPVCVVVGQQDVLRDDALRKGDKLDQRQGQNRLERGKIWVAEMRRSAALYGVQGEFRFVSVPDCGHSFLACMQQGMGHTIFQFLCEKNSGRAVALA